MHAKYSKAKFAPWHNGSFQIMNVKMHWWRHFQEAYHCSRDLCIISIILLSISHFHEVISWIYWSCKLYINFINNACFEDKCHKVNAIRKWRQIMVETKNSSGTLSTNDELVQEGFPQISVQIFHWSCKDFTSISARILKQIPPNYGNRRYM